MPFFFLKNPATTEIYTLPLPDALPISAFTEPAGTDPQERGDPPRQRRGLLLCPLSTIDAAARPAGSEEDMPERPLPTEKDVRAYIRDRRNWGRWGKDDQVGALNLVTPAKRAAAARLVRSGRAVSLSRPFPKEPGPNNAFPAQHYMRTLPRGRGGFAADYYGIFYHGVASTHIDALCHTWDDEAMWNGRDPRKEITFDGATFGAIEHWADGILTRGVMLDVPRPARDLSERLPMGYAIPWAVHAALFAYGVALLDNALLEPLARACADERRDEFMLVIAPLPVVGGTGSPANPIAVF